MSGYSGTPLARKLGYKQSSRAAVLGAPEGFVALLEPLPEGAVTEVWSGLKLVVRKELRGSAGR